MASPFDIIVVHSLSRFCRDQFTWAITKRDLSRAGIIVQSMTQPLGEDPIVSFSNVTPCAMTGTPAARNKDEAIATSRRMSRAE